MLKTYSIHFIDLFNRLKKNIHARKPIGTIEHGLIWQIPVYHKYQWLTSFTLNKRVAIRLFFSVLATTKRSKSVVSESTSALKITDLYKSFDKPAVNGLSLDMHVGEFYALLGPNGAGKTTTLRMVSGLLQPDRGEISIFGIDALRRPVEAKSILAWVSDEPMIYEKLTPYEYLEFIAGLWNIDASSAQIRAGELLEWLDLAPHGHERCEGFSKGMRQKVALAGALIHDPKLIILDEPLTGLDAGSARQVKRVLRERVAAGVTVILTTHILEVAERMADRIGVIANGQLIAEGSLDELHKQAAHTSSDGDASLEDTFLQLVADREKAA